MAVSMHLSHTSIVIFWKFYVYAACLKKDCKFRAVFLKFHIELYGYVCLGKTGLSKVKSKGLKKKKKLQVSLELLK